MKKIITTTCIFLFLFSIAVAQNPHPFELGFNVGAAWLKSDVKTAKTGSGAGLTFGQTYCMNQTSPLLWGWRFRYLNANTYGQDTKKSYGIANNEVLNGSDTLLDYYHTTGYVYHNYKTQIDELSVEVLLGANKFRERTNLYPYIFGGAGLTKAVAKIDQLNDNKRYDYIKADSTGSSIKGIYDGSYETLADGNLRPRWKFMPSAGVGLGFEVIKGFSIGLEHKMTWAFNDVLDGQRWSATNSKTGNNDMYHYTSFWIKFSFGRGKKRSGASTTTNTTTQTTTYTAPNAAPAVTFSNPSSSPFNTASKNMAVSGTITNIRSAGEMSMMLNGSPVNGFTYNESTHTFNYPATLQPGANTFAVTATNSIGTGNASATVIYEQPAVMPNAPPVVTILFPAQSPYSTNQPEINVSGTVQNISGREQMQIMLNGLSVNNFTYTPATREFNMNANLIQGANTVVVSASNPFGNNSKTVTVINKREAAAVIPPPVVTITSPSANPYNTTVNTVPVKATILNITAAGQLEVLLNGAPVPASRLNYNLSSHLLTFTATLIQGANTVEIAATNVSGRDSRSETIIYTAPEVIAAPVITITNPASNPFNTTTNSETINASVLNISSAGQITVTLNGGPIPTSALSYNLTSHQLTFNANLIEGANAIVVAATNMSGSDSKTETIIYTKRVQTPAPVVTITNPASNPYTSGTSSATVNASILNITAAGQISVTLNGGPLPASALNYNAASHQLTFNVNLIGGANTIVVSATNVAGSDSKTETIIFRRTAVAAAAPPVVTITNPNVNPYSATSPVAAVSATVMNVSAANQITVTVNGAVSNAFTFNAASHQVSLSLNLINGSNTVTIAASNADGNDSKTQTINYAVPVKPPVVSFITPASGSATSLVATFAITAQALNVSNSGQITVKVNNTPVTAFTFQESTQKIAFTANLIPGNNTVEIKATNTAGTDTKTANVIFRKSTKPGDTQTILKPDTLATQNNPNSLPGGNPPQIVLQTPATNAIATSESVFTISVQLVNVVSASEVTVKVNGAAFPGFSYNTKTKQLSVPVTLNAGANTIVITASNTGGSKTETFSITKMSR